MIEPKIGDVTVVTGGLSGIGAATAAAVAAKSRRVVILDRQSATDTKAMTGITIFPEPVDVSDETAVAAACEKIEKSYGSIIGLVNAAGILGKMHPPSRLSMKDWDREIAVDLRGTFIVCREVGSRMARRKAGAIVNIASVVGILSAPVHGYAPAKAAVIHLTATLAAEWGPLNVRVNCVCPGFTDTPALAKGLAAGVFDRKRLMQSAALRRLVKPEEVASAIVWLLSDEASGITGANLPVDGGFIVGVPWLAFGELRAAAEPH